MFPSSRNVSRVRFNKLTAMSAVGNDVSAPSTYKCLLTNSLMSSSEFLIASLSPYVATARLGRFPKTDSHAVLYHWKVRVVVLEPEKSEVVSMFWFHEESIEHLFYIGGDCTLIFRNLSNTPKRLLVRFGPDKVHCLMIVLCI